LGRRAGRIGVVRVGIPDRDPAPRNPSRARLYADPPMRFADDALGPRVELNRHTGGVLRDIGRRSANKIAGIVTVSDDYAYD